MPRVDATLLIGIDIAGQAAGAVALVIFVMRWLRVRVLRDPLAAASPAESGPGAVTLLGGFLLAIYLPPILAGAAGMRVGDVGAPGSHGWHVAAIAHDAGRLIAGAFIALRLAGRPGVAGYRPPRSWPRLAGVALLAAWLVTPVCTLQLLAGRTLWRWFRPSAAPPVHLALEALERSEWGVWGAAQLVFSALVVAPLVEELLFRGLLLPVLARWSGRVWLAVAISGILFGLIHVRQPQDVVPLCTFGLTLGIVRVRFGSIAVCILAHALFNARTMGFVLLNPELIRMEW